MARNHVCTGSDHISKLAADAGFEHWSTVWDENGSLKSKRANPNLLFKGDKLHPQGDTVKIPEHDPGSTSAAVDANHPFTVGNDQLFLRLRVLKDDFTALANAQYTLTVDGAAAPFTGRTNGQGQLEKEIPRTATQATLTVTASAPASGSGSTGGGSGGGVCAEAPVTWQLQIGRLNPIMENAPDQWCIAGVQQRLNNLGISTGPIDGIKGRLTEAAIKTFQRLFGLEEDGKPGKGETQPKLQDVHDKPDSVLGPKAPPNDSQHANTPDNAYGHVCPDFDDRKVFNTLRLRSTYRLTLRLGSLEELFPHSPDSPEGRMERLQVLGMFYFPLSHRHAARAFNGIPASGTATAVRGIWEYFKTQILNNADDAAADQEIQRLLREWVVAAAGLPTPADEGVAPIEANFSKLRLPGGYSFAASDNSSVLNLNNDPAYPQLIFGRNMYLAEDKYLKDNPVLHKIPLIAKVEKFDQATCKWVPAQDATVYFQLIDPYDLPAFDATKSVTAQLNRPPIRSSTLGPPGQGANAGPNLVVNREENPTGGRAPNAQDPQRKNARSDRGGKAGQGNLTDGSDVADKLFSTTSQRGFNAAHSAPAKGTVNPITRTVFFPLAERVNDNERQHAVKAKTNSDGEAGAVFLPSRCGGDRYRFRAFLGPPTVNGAGSDGKGATAVKVDTGTFVIWRHLRISRFVQQAVNNVSATLLADAQAAGGLTTNVQLQNRYNLLSTANGYLQFRAVSVIDSTGTNLGLSAPDFSTAVSGGPPAFESLPVQWARAFVEVEIDRAASVNLPETMTQADWDAARRQALADGLSGMGTIGINIDLRRLLFLEPGAPAIAVDQAVCNIPTRTPETYNQGVAAAKRIGTGGNTVDHIEDLLENYALAGFLRFFTSNGYCPGLGVVYGAMGAGLQVYRRKDFSGLALEYRGAFLWYGAATYVTDMASPFAASHNGNFPYSFTCNVCHELGHVVFRAHAPGHDPGEDDAGGAKAANHDKNTPTDNNLSVCIMSYQTCEGEYCGKCLLSFRGWNMAQIAS